MKIIPNYSVIYSDDSILVVNKKSGMLTASDRYDNESPRLDLELKKEFGEIYAVHRIDKDASGIVVYAKTEEAFTKLREQFEEKQVCKIYHCLINGHPMWESIKCNSPIQPDCDDRHRSKVNKRFGKSALTNFKLIGTCGPYSWISAEPVTDRTHQIRVHLQEQGASIVCDPLYSGNQKPVRLSDFKKKYNGDTETENPLLKRLAMHAYSIKFAHPVSGEPVEYFAPYPKDMDATRNQLAKVFKIDPIA